MAGNFECTQCGLCCLGIGEIVCMDNQLSRYGFVVKNEVVREMKQALITPEYRDIFENDHSVQKENPSACFFVRRRSDGKYVCTIHPYRLFICRDYHCCAARIFTEGKEAGRVKGRVSLVTKDSVLADIWREGVQKHPDPSHEYIDGLMKKHGYTIVFYDGE
ncbi:MAG: YkgJ family cysteine cluster protein [Methanocorpusculum sp.]|nr:YkgJ family cysteine cluster protein [Methanocorpusculum sp.]